MEKTRKFTFWQLIPFARKRIKLYQEFEFARTTFFPRWDIDRQWMVKYAPAMPGGGWADPETKTIFLSSIPKELDMLYLLLIHEMN